MVCRYTPWSIYTRNQVANCKKQNPSWQAEIWNSPQLLMFITARHKSVFCSRWIQSRSSHIISSWWGEGYPFNGSDRPLGLQGYEAPKICRQTACEGGNVGRSTHRPPLTPGDILSTHFCYRLSRPHGHISSRYISTLSSQLRLILPDRLFPSAFGFKIL